MTIDETVAELIVEEAILAQQEHYQIICRAISRGEITMDVGLLLLTLMRETPDVYVYEAPGGWTIRYQLYDDNLSAAEVMEWYRGIHERLARRVELPRSAA